MDCINIYIIDIQFDDVFWGIRPPLIGYMQKLLDEIKRISDRTNQAPSE